MDFFGQKMNRIFCFSNILILWLLKNFTFNKTVLEILVLINATFTYFGNFRGLNVAGAKKDQADRRSKFNSDFFERNHFFLA